MKHSFKSGRRNNAQDQEAINALHDIAVSLGAYCPAYEEESEEESEEVPEEDVEGEEVTKSMELVTPSPETRMNEQTMCGVTIKPVDMASLSLDTIVRNVHAEFYALESDERRKHVSCDDEPRIRSNDTFFQAVEVHNGYAIARLGIVYFIAPYYIHNERIKLADKSEWKQVEHEWAMKNISAENMKTFHRRQLGNVQLLGDDRVGNYLVAWGDEQSRDLYGEYFTKNTKGLDAFFKYIGKIPALYQHAMDGAVKYTPVGVIDVMELDEYGLWTETQLDLANKYAQRIKELARRRALGASSGTLPGARKVSAKGEILEWPIIEGSFTPTPAEPRLHQLSLEEAKAVYKSFELEFPDDIEMTQKAEGAEEAQQDAVKTVSDLEKELAYISLLEL